MNPILSYTPEYVLRLQQNEDACGCPGSLQRPQLVSFSWQDQVRHSAWIGCDRAAHEILCREDAFVLHSEVAAEPGTERLDTRQQAVNQAAINLAIVSDAAPGLILYTLGVLLSKSQQLKDAQQIEALGDELAGLLEQGAMAEAFAQLPAVDTYKLDALRTLSRSELDASLDPLTGMTLVLKLNELNVLSPRYLQDMLRTLEQDPRLADFMRSRRSVFINALLYTFYHQVFPGADDAGWPQQFHRLCRHYFSLKMLCALFIQGELPLDDDTLAALFAAWERIPPAGGCDNPLLAGISLLS